MKELINKYDVRYLEHDPGEIPEGHEEIINARIGKINIPEIGECLIDIPTSYNKEKVSESPYIKIYNNDAGFNMCIGINCIEEISNDKIMCIIKESFNTEELLNEWKFWNNELEEFINA